MEFYSLVIIVLLWNFLGVKKCPSLDSDINRNVSELISSKGYPMEEYEVKTSDGYILSLQRIPHGRDQQKSKKCQQEVVILMHGTATHSSSWVANFPELSLGFALADGGHDVWLGNFRGSVYSRKHVNLTPDMKEFWELSIDEMAAYDIPAMIYFVLNKANNEQLVFIGHSQGTTAMFALLSESPEYNKKPILRLFGIYQLSPPTIIEKYLKTGACNRELKYLCKGVIFGTFGYDPWQLNETRLSFYSTLMLSGTSVKNAEHLAQVKKTQKFQKYDYGSIQNMRHKNQATPPVYDITKITTPVVLMWGRNDKIAGPKDVHEIEKQLQSLALSYPITYEDFNHIDFLLAIDGYKLSHVKVLELLCKVSQ